MPKHLNTKRPLEETHVPTTLVGRLENALEAYEEARQNTVSSLCTLEGAMLAFRAKKVYGVRRWSAGISDARTFVVRSILEGRTVQHPSHEQFMEAFPDDKGGELYRAIIEDNSKQRERHSRFPHTENDKAELRAIVPWFFDPPPTKYED